MAKVVKLISREDLGEMFKNMHFTTPASMVVITSPRVKKPKQNIIQKVAYIKVMLGNWNYERCVNNRKIKRGDISDFKAKERKWGKHISNSPLIVKGNEKYVQVSVLQVCDTFYIKNGQNMIKEEIDQVLYDRTSSQQNKKMMVRSYKLDSIRSLTYNKTTYHVV